MSDADPVLRAFEALVRPPADQAGRVFSAAAVGPGGVRVAKSGDGRAALLVPGSETTRAPIVTRYVRADFGAHCRVREHGQTVDEVGTVVECMVGEPEVTQQFLLAVGSVFSSLTAPSDAGTALSSLIEMFRAMTRPPRSSVQGLWGELFLMSRSSDPLALIRQWHVSPHDRHDFAADGQRLEVKTASGGQRRHRFSYEQLSVPDGATLVVVSIMVEPSAAGATIADLIEDTTARVGNATDPRLRVLTGVADALGSEWELANHQRYDTAVAAESMRFFLGESLPTLPGPVPDAISDVRFSIDLSRTPTIDTAQLRTLGGMFGDASIATARNPAS